MNGWIPLDKLLLARIDRGIEQARLNAGEALRCKRGCFHCCLGPFPITQADAFRLRAGFARLPEEQRQRVRDKAAEVAARLPDRQAGDWLFDRDWQLLPCPALDLETGSCELYEHRPVACRTYGSAIRLDGVSLRTCPLNYQGWTAGQIDDARVDITSEDQAAAVVEAMGVDGPLTTVAQAITHSGV